MAKKITKLGLFNENNQTWRAEEIGCNINDILLSRELLGFNDLSFLNSNQNFFNYSNYNRNYFTIDSTNGLQGVLQNPINNEQYGRAQIYRNMFIGNTRSYCIPILPQYINTSNVSYNADSSCYALLIYPLNYLQSPQSTGAISLGQKDQSLLFYFCRGKVLNEIPAFVSPSTVFQSASQDYIFDEDDSYKIAQNIGKIPLPEESTGVTWEEQETTSYNTYSIGGQGFYARIVDSNGEGVDPLRQIYLTKKDPSDKYFSLYNINLNRITANNYIEYTLCFYGSIKMPQI